MITIKEDIQETHTFSLLVDNEAGVLAVSYTHLTLPTNREV